MASHYGSPLFDPLNEKEEEDNEKELSDYFPDMSAVKNVSRDRRSGLIIITPK